MSIPIQKLQRDNQRGIRCGHRPPVAEADDYAPVPDNVRIDGRVCLVTGSNTGLGKAVAIDLARRGGHVLMACRSGHPEAGEEVRRISGSDRVEMLKVDLADLNSVHGLCDRIERRGRRLDIIVLNAGLMPRGARRSPQGYELMFAVHFLANRVLIDRFLGDGLIQPSIRGVERPRIVIVNSESRPQVSICRPHRLRRFRGLYGLWAEGWTQVLCSQQVAPVHLRARTVALMARLNPEGEVRVAVNSLCPGPVNSNIAREAPPFLKPLLYPVMKLLFASPEKAANLPARNLPVLCRGNGAAHRRVSSPDAGKTGFAAGQGQGRRRAALASQRGDARETRRMRPGVCGSR